MAAKSSYRQVTFSKKQISKIINVALFDLQLSYVLAFMGKEQIAETLSVTIVTAIIGVMLGYFMKSFFETREEERLSLEKQLWDKGALSAAPQTPQTETTWTNSETEGEPWNN